MVDRRYSYKRSDRDDIAGPFAVGDFLERVCDGTIAPTTEVGCLSSQTESSIHWIQARNLPGLFEGANPTTETKLGGFINAYHSALGSELASRGPAEFPFHGDVTESVIMVKAADGFAIFYLPALADDDSNGLRGFNFFDHATYDLNTVCQSVSLRRLRAFSAGIGESANVAPGKPPETEPIPGFAPAWFDEKVRQGCLSGAIKDLPGLAVGPTVQVSDGIRRSVVPRRLKLWSPVYDFPGIGSRRQFLWTHADFWWLPEELDLEPANAAAVAASDLLALGIVREYGAQSSPAVVEDGVPENAADILERTCAEFLQLLETAGDKEETLHQWLNKKEHWIFLDARAKDVKSKVKLGKKDTDFIVRRADDTYVLVEIERANLPIFKESDSEPTWQFHHACTQVKDWQRFVKDNVHMVRDELGLAGIFDPRGMVIMGRRKDIRHDDAVVRWRDMKNTHELELYNYDDIHDNVVALAKSLRNLIGPDDEHGRHSDGWFGSRPDYDSGERQPTPPSERKLRYVVGGRPGENPTLRRSR
jgi:hypothetical protein